MQRVPAVSRDDVLRVIRREFPAEVFAAVLALLDRYGAEPWERERDRVQLAVLKLASGSVGEVERRVAAARRDYRDALAQAEYPESLTSVLLPEPPSGGDRREADERDREQYRLWLERA